MSFAISTVISVMLAAIVAQAGCAANLSYAASKDSAGEVREAPAAGLSASPPPGSIGTNAPANVGDAKPAADVKPVDARLVIYSAGYRLVVADVAGTLQSIQASAEKLGGYMQEISGGSIIIRVPAARFSDACRQIEQAGQVVDRQVKAQDVTEQMRDLKIHLDNAEKLRQRFLDILAKTEKVEDALKVETELARVTAEIDSVKGKIRFLESQLAMSTIRVDLNAAVPQTAQGAARLPFAWVEQLGDGLVAGQVRQNVRKAGFFSRGPAFKPPAGFVRYFEASSETEAMDGGGLLLRVQRQNNVDDASLDFWAKLARKTLVEGRSLSVAGEENDGRSYVLRGTRDVGGKPFGYLLTIRRSEKVVIVFEAWGPNDLFEPKVKEIRAAGLSTEP